MEYVGERDSRAELIAEIWQGRVASPLRSDLAQQVTPGELVPVLLPPILD